MNPFTSQPLRAIAVLALSMVGVGSAAGAAPGRAQPARLPGSGSQPVTPDGKPIWLRGFNWGRWGTALPEDGVANVQRGANVVRLPFRWYFNGPKADIRQSGAPGNLSPAGLAKLDETVRWATEAGLWVVLFAGSDKGAGDSRENNYWNDPALRREFFDTWAFIVQRYRNTPRIAAYELLSEPHPKKPVTTAQLRGFYEELITHIRRYDTRTPLMIGPNDHYDIGQLQGVHTRVDNKVIYATNFYLPTEYCKPSRRGDFNPNPIVYPSAYRDRRGVTRQLDAAALAAAFQPALDFRERNKVPVFIDQIGCVSAAPGVLPYTRDLLALMRKHQMHWAFWTYRVYHAGPDEHGLWYDDGKGWKLKAELDSVLRAAMSP